MRPSRDRRDRDRDDSTDARRILFQLSQNEDGYPPLAVETMWATYVGEGAYRIDNIPFFATRVSLGDVIEADLIDGRPTFARVRERGGHSTLRVVAFDAATVPEVRSAIQELGCATELSHLPRLISVDVPPSASLEALRAFLAAGAAQGRWDYEEADVPA
jgi:uncharacterized protein DUF4265